MAFAVDFTGFKTVRALASFVAPSPDMFDAVLAFVPPPPPSAEPDSSSKTIGETPMFFRHEIPKRNKRGTRTVWQITFLKNEYKALARRLDSFFRMSLESYPHPASFGYRPGRNILENAAVHTGRRNLLTVDIADFFPTITKDWLATLFKNVGMEAAVADALAAFVTIGGRLPLGLPTSPVLSNAICVGLDHHLQALAEASGCAYSRYADDMSFSSDGALPHVEAIRAVIEAHGFALADKKTHRSVIGQAHYVTGLSVSDPARPHVPKAKKRRLRQEMHYARKFGLDDHFRHQGINDKTVMQEQVNRLDGMVKFIAHHEPALRQTIKPVWDVILRKAGMRPSFHPKNQHRIPFDIFVDEAEFDRDGTKVLALGMAVTQHSGRIFRASHEVLEAATSDPFAAGDVDAIRKRGLHYTDATLDLRLAYVQALGTLPFEGYVAMAPVQDPSAYQATYLRLLGALLPRRLMAAESQFVRIVLEQTDKVSQAAVKVVIAKAFEDLKAHDNRRPKHIVEGFVSKPHLAVSVPDFLLGVLGGYLKSNDPPLGNREPRERLLFERLRDKVRVILDLGTEPWTEYSRRNPIAPWCDWPEREPG